MHSLAYVFKKFNSHKKQEYWMLRQPIASNCCSFTILCPTFCDPMDCSMPGFPSLTISWSLPKFMSIESVMSSNHIILCHPLLPPPLMFPSIRVFSNESVLCIRWPKYWSFSFSISPSNEYSGLLSFRMDWLDLLADLRALLEPCYSPSGVVYSLLLESGRHSVTALTIRMLQK